MCLVVVDVRAARRRDKELGTVVACGGCCANGVAANTQRIKGSTKNRGEGEERKQRKKENRKRRERAEITVRGGRRLGRRRVVKAGEMAELCVNCSRRVSFPSFFSLLVSRKSRGEKGVFVGFIGLGYAQLG